MVKEQSKTVPQIGHRPQDEETLEKGDSHFCGFCIFEKNVPFFFLARYIGEGQG